MASDIFSVSPPAWLVDLTRPKGPGIGAILGELVAGTAISAQQAGGKVKEAEAKGEDLSWGRAWLRDIPQGIAEARMNMLDPMWRLKVQEQGLRMQALQTDLEVKQKAMDDAAHEQREIPMFMIKHPTWTDRQDALWPTARTAIGERMLNSLRDADTASARTHAMSAQEKIKVQGAQSFTDSVEALTKEFPDIGASLTGFFGRPPTPEAFQALDLANQTAEQRRANTRMAAENEAIARGQVPETRITDKASGVTTVYKSEPAGDKNRDRVGTEMTTPSGIRAVWVGPNQIRITEKSGESKDLTPGQLLTYAEKFKFSTNPTARDTAKQIATFLGEKAAEQIGRGKTNAPAAKPAPAASPTAKPVAVLGSGTESDPAKPNTKEQFDSIPSGSYFLNPADGKLYKKK